MTGFEIVEPAFEAESAYIGPAWNPPNLDCTLMSPPICDSVLDSSFNSDWRYENSSKFSLDRCVTAFPGTDGSAALN